MTLANGTEIKIPTWKTYQELEDKINHLMTNVQSLQSIIKAMQENDYITKVEPIIDLQTNEAIGYTFHFYKGGKLDIYHGKDGKAPEIGIKNHPKLGLCWTFNGEYIIDPTTQLPVALPKDGEDGKDGVTPMLKIVNGEWWMSTNGGKTWTSIGLEILVLPVDQVTLSSRASCLSMQQTPTAMCSRMHTASRLLPIS